MMSNLSLNDVGIGAALYSMLLGALNHVVLVTKWNVTTTVSVSFLPARHLAGALRFGERVWTEISSCICVDGLFRECCQFTLNWIIFYHLSPLVYRGTLSVWVVWFGIPKFTASFRYAGIEKLHWTPQQWLHETLKSWKYFSRNFDRLVHFPRFLGSRLPVPDMLWDGKLLEISCW